jgi:predicted NBD/HSP70 family sugar kinase
MSTIMPFVSVHAPIDGQLRTDDRSKNERDLLELIRNKGPLPKTKLAQLSGLSAQSATVLINKLEKSGLVKAHPPVKGRIGQPQVPFGLKASGAYGLGLKVGRRSFDITLLDLCGNVVSTVHEKIPYPEVDHFLSFAVRAYAAVTRALSEDEKKRIRGVGVAMPFEVWRWAEEAGAPNDVLSQWQNVDLAERLSTALSLPVYISNDATAACTAELSFGNAAAFSNFLYIFVGTFVGGGVVLNNAIFAGTSGNAGAIGSLPFSSDRGEQLINQSSLYLLETELSRAGFDGQQIYNTPDYWPIANSIIASWVQSASAGLAFTAHCATGLLDLEGIIIDGAMPDKVKASLVERTAAILHNTDMKGLSPPRVIEGMVGSKAQSIGSANLPLLANYY